ncbi:glycosyl hydrolases family 31 domain-containing protein [Phthorimaea operculella]|nr:glycosyl hydrolases family 31 domain-containing protein [Phthorimaea operculella]
MTENKHGMRVMYSRGRPSGYPGDFNTVALDFKYLSDDSLQVKIYDAENKRFEVPIPEIPSVPSPISNLKYRVVIDSGSIGYKIIRNSDNVTVVVIDSGSIGYKIIRNSDNVTVINTQDAGALILSDKFLQISTLLPTDRIFGLGEHKDRLKRDVNWMTYTMFNKDIRPQFNVNLYGSHPFYMAVEKDGKSHGALLLNSNAIDVVLQPTPALTYRAIGGILNLLYFIGPSPQEVVSQYTAVIGRPFMPPYWSLGFHLCKFGYHDINTTRKVWMSNRDAGIPFDVQWNDIDYMIDQNDFTYDPVRFKGLPELIKDIHLSGMRYILIIDPGVSGSEDPGKYPPYDRGIEMNVFVKNSSDLPFTGRVWNREATVYPDFTHPNSTSYWVEMMSNFHKQDMNEPSNLITGQIYGGCEPLSLPYEPSWDNQLNKKTICMEAKHHIGRHYDVHNLYALYEAVATHL